MRSLERLPRELKPFERELLLWVLPKERTGYAKYRKLIETWPVAAVGRRGEGNYILAEAGWNVDIESPLPQLFAYGVVEHEQGTLTISILERSGGQLEFEMEGVADRAAVANLRQIRKWSFSEWLPSQLCPSCRSSVREIRMTTTASQTLVLVLCGRDRRIWVYDGQSGVNSLIPVTGFYNELMLQTGIHDPKVALDPNRLFQIPGAQSESQLIRAFSSYNRLRNKVVLEGDLIMAGERKPNWIRRTVASLAGKKKQTRQR
ncbi:MAG: hypothetical protein NTZ35_07220 [Ignavibacteriales bacterium]|nr:hypothetical protein [Ignavibacteriales bacterium]